MTERPESNDRPNEADKEHLRETRDRLSEFVNEGDERDEGRSGDSESTESEDGFEGDATGGDTDEPEGRTRGSNFVVKVAVRERIEGLAVAGDFYDSLDEAVGELLSDAARRAEANGRKTVQARDL
jgi:hypothetical protein